LNCGSEAFSELCGLARPLTLNDPSAAEPLWKMEF
jgi:hypothetical protein